jgi:hypothetical protein
LTVCALFATVALAGLAAGSERGLVLMTAPLGQVAVVLLGHWQARKVIAANRDATASG